MTSVENPCWVGCQTYIYSMPLWAQYFFVSDSAPEENRYGKSPKYAQETF